MKLLDLFSGIGGFHKGLERAGFKFDWVGYSDIDKYANKQYKRRFPDATGLGSVTDVQCENLPDDITILCGGFPCQAFSIAGRRKGFDDTRGTLFFEIARILRYFRDVGKPIPYFILENVKGLLNHQDGQTFATIYRVLTDLDYTVECQLLNTRWFLPQNRERIYIVGHFRGESRPKVFPIGEGSSAIKSKFRERNAVSCIDASYYKGVDGKRTMIQEGLKQIGTIGEDSEATRVYDPSGCSRTIKNGGGMGAKTGLYAIHDELYKGRKSRKYTDAAPTLRGNSGQLQVKPVLTPDRAEKRQNGRRFKDDGEDMFTLTSQDQHGVMEGSKIRRLTPIECERLQGFPDGWTEGQSDTQRYKQLGNAVTVPVVKAIGEKLITIIKNNKESK